MLSERTIRRPAPSPVRPWRAPWSRAPSGDEMDAKYGDKARGGSLGLSLRLPRRRGSGTGTAVRRTICALLAFALLVYLPLRSIAGGTSSAAGSPDTKTSPARSYLDRTGSRNQKTLLCAHAAVYE